MRPMLPLLFAAFLSLPCTARGQAYPDAEAAIAEATDAWLTAWNAGDAASIAALYTTDAMLLPPGAEPVKGHDAIQAFWQKDLESGWHLTLKTTEVLFQGDMAITVGSYVFTGSDGAHIDHGKYIEVRKKGDGSWKIYRDIWNSSMTP